MKSTLNFLSALMLGLVMAFLPVVLHAQITTAKYYIKYNSTFCYYEAHVVFTGGSASGTQCDAGNCQFTIVVPHGTTITKVADNQPRTKGSGLTIASNWNVPNTSALAPAVTPLVDYRAFTLSTSPAAAYPTISTNDDILLTTFTLSSSTCGAGIRMWRNNNDDGNPDPGGIAVYDPSASASGMGSGNFNNSFTIGSATETYVSGNATSTVAGPNPTISSVTPTCVASTFSLTAVAAPGSTCTSPLTYAWTGPGGFTASGPTFTRTSVTPAMSGTYALLVKDAKGCPANFAKGYDVATCGLLPLAIKLNSFDGVANKCMASLSWQSYEVVGIRNFEVQYSTDGNHFTTVGVVNSEESAGGLYTFHYNQAGGKGYYRLKVTAVSGADTYSQTVTVVTDCTNQVITVSPNPTKGVIYVKGVSVGDEVKVVDMLGQTVASTIATSSTASTDLSRLPAAVYMVIVNQGQNIIKVGQVVKQ